MKPSRLASERGSAMVEFAVVVPVFLAMVFGFVEFSIILFGFCSATYGTEVAVRYAITHSASSASPCTSTMVSNIVKPYLWNSSGTVTTTWLPANTVGNAVKVQVTIQYNTGIPYSSLSKVTLGTAAQGIILY